MKKMIISVLLAGVMMLTAACSSSFDASAYVRACLDVLTKGEYTEYVEITEQTEEEAKADYEENINLMMVSFESMGLSEELLENYRTFFKELYAATKYEVLEAAEDEDGNYTVDVQVSQLTGVFNGVSEDLNAAAAEYGAQLANEGKELDDADINEWVYTKLYELISGNMENISYKEPQTVTVHVVLEEDAYTIIEEDYVAIDEALIDLADLI